MCCGRQKKAISTTDGVDLDRWKKFCESINVFIGLEPKKMEIVRRQG